MKRRRFTDACVSKARTGVNASFELFANFAN